MKCVTWIGSLWMLLIGLQVNLACGQQTPASPWENRASDSVRFATFNVAMNRELPGQLLEELETGQSQQAEKIAEVIQRVRPDILLLCEIDRDGDQQSLEEFCRQYLEVSQNQQAPIHYPHRFFAESNTGVDSRVDLDGNGILGEANDDFGFGQFPGKYAMAVVSRYPLDTPNVRTFQEFLWNRMPQALWPRFPETGQPFYPETSKGHLRLSSKSHWVLPVQTPQGTIHFLVAHPTPPVFDGPEDRNGRRNHDEIRLLADLVRPDAGQYLVDDQGRAGPLAAEDKFVIAGDLNADPHDGDSSEDAVQQLLEHNRVQANHIPTSPGAVEASHRQAGVNRQHRGDPAADTSDFNDQNVGNLRLDYVLPSRNLKVTGTGVFWPRSDHPLHRLVDASDHRLVWLDVK